MENIHKHTHWSNIFTPDSVVNYEDYAKRATELGHTVLSSLEHGWQGNYYLCSEIAKRYGLKFIFGSEAYFVKDRHEKDRTNAHIVMLARNESGRRAINKVLSRANVTGYYYKPRVDLQLLKLLPAEDVVVTTACVGGIWQYEDYDDVFEKIYKMFGSSLYLEVQYHKTLKQVNINDIAIQLSEKYGVELIAGYDSHYIYPEQSVDRDLYIQAKGIHYEGEEGWFMDYPDDETAAKRFLEQGVLSEEQIIRAMDNTDIVHEFEEFDFDKEIKLPNIYKNLTQYERNMKYAKLVADRWKNIYSKNIDPSLHPVYIENIKKEIMEIVTTNMSDYFLIDYEIVKRGVELGGVITKTGRGSGVSFYSNTLLGFSDVDRISASVHMYPERFLSAERILETKSLPDLDLNLGTPEIFEQAQEEVVGEGHSVRLIAFGKFKVKSAWKIFCKAKEIDYEIANEVSKQIEKFEKVYKYAEDEDKPLIKVENYIDAKYVKIFEESKTYRNIISDKKVHACGYLLYDGDIESEIGLIKCKSESTKKEYITAVIDGKVVDKYNFLKNDLLKVNSVLFYHDIFKRAGVPILSAQELINTVKNDSSVWKIYEKGLVLNVNQVERDSTREKVMKYKPKNVAELCAFIAAIRPGFKSMYEMFENRVPFTYKIPAFDALIQTEEFPYSYLLYQEQIMQALNWVGFPMHECYSIIKAISKKYEDVIMNVKDRFVAGFIEKTQDQANAERVWQVIEDAAKYSFNASHSYSMALDSLYLAYLKAHYPLEFYEVSLQAYSESGNKNKVILIKKEMREVGIQIGEVRWGNDNRGFSIVEEENLVNQSILSLKKMNYKVSDQLYKLSQSDIKLNDFVDVMVALTENTGVDKTKMEILIKIGYFSKFGSQNKLLDSYEFFREVYKKTHVEKTKLGRIEKVRKHFNSLQEEWYSVNETIRAEMEYFGYIQTQFEFKKDYIVVYNINRKYFHPYITLCTICNGHTETFKFIKWEEAALPLEVGDIIVIKEAQRQGRYINGAESDTEFETVIKRYNKVKLIG